MNSGAELGLPAKNGFRTVGPPLADDDFVEKDPTGRYLRV